MYDETRLEILLEAYFDQELTRAEREELERMLLSSGRAREIFWERAAHHSSIRQWGMQEWGRQMAGDLAGADLASATAIEPPLPRLEPRRRRSPFVPWIGWALAGATCVFLLLNIARSDRADSAATDTPDTGVAVITRLAGIAWSDPTEDLNPGAALAPGWLKLQRGLVHLEFYSGARLIVEGPAELQLISATEAYCKSGKLNVYVPDQARGFTLRSPEVDLLDLGTAFGINVPVTGPSEVHVFGGEVQLTRVGPRAVSQRLNEGEALQVDSGRTSRIALAPDAFVSLSELTLRQSAELTLRLDAWRTSNHAINQDPATLVHYTFQGEPDVNRRIRNDAVKALPVTEGSLVGCEWVEGRWPGKAALEFKSRSDRVRLGIPGRHENLTCAAWVRVDSLPRQYNGLLLSEELGVGEARWELGQNGEIRFGVRVEPKVWERAISPPVITPDRFGQWLHIVTTFDHRTRTVSHFLNGKRVAEIRMARSLPVQFGHSEIGNWGVRADNPALLRNDEKYLTRSLNGRIDEFTVASRAFTPQEIEQRYEVGKPAATRDAPNPYPLFAFFRR